MPRRDRQTGFSLIELVLVLVLTGVLGAVAAYGIRSGTDAWRATDQRLRAQRELRSALERLLREFRAVRHDGTGYDFLVRTASRARFRKEEAGLVHEVDLQLNGSTLLLALDGNPGQPLVHGVTALNFDWLQADGNTPATSNADVAFVEVTLGLSDPASRAYLEVGRAGLRRRP